MGYLSHCLNCLFPKRVDYEMTLPSEWRQLANVYQCSEGTVSFDCEALLHLLICIKCFENAAAFY